ncbi:PREDICTED: uncharacterized protein LOC108357695 [Rhagoletis zephyria]|uniref:uncharacterized protein LOC108357695 n=1 Tax=Rhagoletis zephyria TaxID=28612 RepID=UPI0008115717|nr:PREDICTED: uncharacterized protein LOC108357695 [Rhagoletis zephyria]XP_036332851.1 uncharacterized protein LOC118744167 [Rhagoletis pomonella]
MLGKYSVVVQPLSRLLAQRKTYFLKVQQRNASGNPKSSPNENSNEPIKFFGSQAANWRARDTRSGGSEDTLWFQPYVISGSLAIFLLYFCILREENDIDRRLEGNLFDQVAGLEEVQLTVNYKYNKENGLDTSEIEKRLSELGIDIKQLHNQ